MRDIGEHAYTPCPTLTPSHTHTLIHTYLILGCSKQSYIRGYLVHTSILTLHAHMHTLTNHTPTCTHAHAHSHIPHTKMHTCPCTPSHTTPTCTLSTTPACHMHTCTHAHHHTHTYRCVTVTVTQSRYVQLYEPKSYKLYKDLRQRLTSLTDLW